MTDIGHKKQIQEFVKVWTGRGYEKGESQKFWLELLEILGISNPFQYITFEDQVHIDHTSFIDGYIPKTHVLIEQKSLGKDLRASIKQSDGTFLTPFQQAKRYSAELPYSERPRWIVTCNFSEFLVYDMERPSGEPESIMLKDLEKEVYRLQFLVNEQDAALQREMELSLQAGELVGRLYDALLQQYIDPTSDHALHSLNALCVRLVFCLYAEDAGLFASHAAFHDYIASFNVENSRDGLRNLFEMLNTQPNDRDPYASPELLSFPYVNGGLFADNSIEIPRLTPEIINLLLKDCSTNFDWSGISPTIFGAVFESTLNPETRRSGGMHYTSIENIHKVIDPLFLDELNEEFRGLSAIPFPNAKTQKLKEFQRKLASLTFLDPACGSGNFLTETYTSLRRLENKVIRQLYGGGETFLGSGFSPVQVSLNQFYGIEINDFAVAVAQTALWIAEVQMMKETEDIVQSEISVLPLKNYHNIVEGNALRLDWSLFPVVKEATDIYAHNTNIVTIGENNLHDPVVRYGDINLHTETLTFNAEPITKKWRTVHYDYIISNPPFVGYSLQTKEQKDDIRGLFVDEREKPYSTAGKLDYVAGWYFKAAQLIDGTSTRVAFVSTNSIAQGEQVVGLWKPLMNRFGVHIDFAYRAFQWNSESDFKVHVHCVIISFSCGSNEKPRVIFDQEKRIIASNISPYLTDSESIFIEGSSKPICDVPLMITGNRPADGGHLIIEDSEKAEFLRKEPSSSKYIKRLIGASEFISGKNRWCLWLKDTTPSELRKMPEVMMRVTLCREDRLASPDEGRQKLAVQSWLFRETNNPESYIVVPATSSERRSYIPIGFLDDSTIPTNSVLIIPDATLYHFGVLTSSVHMAWMRVVCGRLKSDYRYSKDIVYNNFPWPAEVGSKEETAYESAHLDSELKARIEKTAQAILDARALYPDSSLADLYDEVTMPKELRRAHRDNDLAVMAAYGFPQDISEAEIVAKLMGLYRKLVTPENDH